MKRFGRNDWILIGALSLVCAVFVVFFSLRDEKGENVVVTVDGETWGTYPLAEAGCIEIEAEDGHVTNVLVIEDEKAYIREADCPDKLCVHQRAVGRTGESLVCLPNRVVVTVEGGKENGLDGFVR